MKYTYFDNAASAPMLSVAKKALFNTLEVEAGFANPNATHSQGRAAFNLLEDSRFKITKLLHIPKPKELIFTSGGTESNHLALFGLALGIHQQNPHKNKIIISAIEHAAIHKTAKLLTKLGFKLLVAPVDDSGVVKLDEFQNLIDEDVALVSIMTVNNEMGAIQPINELADITHKVNASFHTDAVQALCKIPIDCNKIDAASFSAHKIGGPRGVGALYVSSRVPFKAISTGGGQEFSRRSGTQNVPGIASFAAAVEDQITHMDERVAYTQRLRELFCKEIFSMKEFKEARANQSKAVHPGIISVITDGLDAETIQIRLDVEGFSISGGAACSSNSLDPSPVLIAMGLSRTEALSATRVSFDHRTSEDDMKKLICAYKNLVAV